MKKHEHIERLIGRFLDGDTSNAEERELYAFFAGGDIPEHLREYRELFAWFDGGLEQEIRSENTPAAPERRPKHRFRIWATVAAVAATVALLLLIRPVSVPDEFDPFEGSYIVRNGVKITDPEVIRSELEATLEYVRKDEEEQFDRLFPAYENEVKNILDQWERRKEVMDYINSFPEGEARQEVIGMFLMN